MPPPLPSHRMIEAFRAAVLHGGIGAAAEALGTSQPALSRDIANLQKLVGFQLFAKHGRTVRPTEEALALMAKVQQSFLGLEDIARFYEQLRKQRIGRLSVCAIPAIGHSVMPAAMEFLRRRQEKVVVSLEIASSIEVARRVRNRQADLGFAAQGLAFGDVEAVAEFTSDCVCIAAAGQFPAGWRQVGLAQLPGRAFVALRGTLQKRLQDMLDGIGAELDVVAEASQSLSASELVLRGMGVSVVDPFTAAMHRQKGGSALPLAPALPYTVQALAMGDARMGAPARDLLQYVQSVLGASD